MMQVQIPQDEEQYEEVQEPQLQQRAAATGAVVERPPLHSIVQEHSPSSSGSDTTNDNHNTINDGNAVIQPPNHVTVANNGVVNIKEENEQQQQPQNMDQNGSNVDDHGMNTNDDMHDNVETRNHHNVDDNNDAAFSIVKEESNGDNNQGNSRSAVVHKREEETEINDNYYNYDDDDDVVGDNNKNENIENNGDDGQSVAPKIEDKGNTNDDTNDDKTKNFTATQTIDLCSSDSNDDDDDDDNTVVDHLVAPKIEDKGNSNDDSNDGCIENQGHDGVAVPKKEEENNDNRNYDHCSRINSKHNKNILTTIQTIDVWPSDSNHDDDDDDITEVDEGKQKALHPIAAKNTVDGGCHGTFIMGSVEKNDYAVSSTPYKNNSNIKEDSKEESDSDEDKELFPDNDNEDDDDNTKTRHQDATMKDTEEGEIMDMEDQEETYVEDMHSETENESLDRDRIKGNNYDHLVAPKIEDKGNSYDDSNDDCTENHVHNSVSVPPKEEENNSNSHNDHNDKMHSNHGKGNVTTIQTINLCSDSSYDDDDDDDNIEADDGKQKALHPIAAKNTVDDGCHGTFIMGNVEKNDYAVSSTPYKNNSNMKEDSKEESDSDEDKELFPDNDNDDDDFNTKTRHQDATMKDTEEGEIVDMEDQEESHVEDFHSETENEFLDRDRIKGTNYNDYAGFPFHKYYQSELIKLINECDWDKALHRLRQNKTVKPKEELAQDIDDNDSSTQEEVYEISEVGFVDECGGLPLHVALMQNEAPPDMFVEELLHKGMAFQSAKKRHKLSYLLPLHIACGPGGNIEGKKRDVCDGSREDKILRHLLKAYPEALWVNDEEASENGDGPALNILLVHKPGVKLFDYVLKVLKENQFLRRVLKQEDVYGDLPLHVAVKHCLCPEITLKILNAYEKAVEKPAYSGMYPLHYAALWGCHEKVLDDLIHHHFVAIEKRTKKADGWDTPIHLAFHTRDNVDRWDSRNDYDDDGNRDENSIMRPGYMVKVMLKEFYARLDENYGQGYTTKKKKRKRNNQAQEESYAFQRVQTLCKGRKFCNASKCTLVEQMQACARTGSFRPSQDFKEVHKFINDIVSGRNVL